MSIKDNIKDPRKAGYEAYQNGHSVHYDPYRNMGFEYSNQQALWHEGYEEAKSES